MNNDFFSIDGYGELKIDKVFFEISYPILFTCIDKNKNLFICVCCQNNRDGRKWLISKTNKKEIIKLLKNEITIRNVFLEGNDKFSINEIGHHTKIVKDDKIDWAEDSIFLPKAGEYLEAETGEFEEEIKYYESGYLALLNEIKVPVENHIDNRFIIDLFKPISISFGTNCITNDINVISEKVGKIFNINIKIRVDELECILRDYQKKIDVKSSKMIELGNIDSYYISDKEIYNFNFLEAA